MTWLAGFAFDDIGASTVEDLTGNGHDITLTGTAGAQVADGQTGGALGKTGATMPVAPAGLLAAAQSDDRTVMFDALGNLTTWWVRFQDDGIGSGTWGVLNIGGSMAVQARNVANSLATRPTAAQPEAAVWHNYAATYERATGQIRIYRDGAVVDTETFAAGTQLSVSADRIDLAEWATAGPAIDNLRFADHCADAAEIAALAGEPVTDGALPEITGTAAFTTPAGQLAGGGATTTGGTGLFRSAAGQLAAAGDVLVTGPASFRSGAGQLAAAGRAAVRGVAAFISAAGQLFGRTSSLVGGVGLPEHTFTIDYDDRVFVIERDDRAWEIPHDDRTWEVE